MAGALGVVITTDVPMSGQHAQPVYVDDSLPIVGPSQAIVVTSGEVPQMGGPPLAVRLAPAGTPALGPALPVYVVSGSLGNTTPAPVNSVLPVVSGAAELGSTLTTTDGTWSGAPTYTYQWKRGGVSIGGATANTYVLVLADLGTTITAEVTATNAGGSTAATSAGTTIPAYLLLDRFTIDQAAPLTTPRTCVPGPGTLAITDTGNKYSIASGVMTSGANLSTGTLDPRVENNVTLARVAGRALIGSLKRGNTAGQDNSPIFGWATTNNTESAEDAILFSNNNPSGSNYSFAFSATFAQFMDNFTLGVANTVAVILRSAGAWCVVDNVLVYVSSTGITANLYAAMYTRNGAGRALGSVANLRIIDLPSPWNTDYGIATDRKAVSAAADTITQTADAIIEHTFTAATGVTKEIYIRQSDASNRWIIRCDQTGATVKLIELNAAVETERATAAQTWTNGTSYRVVAVMHGTVIRVYVANSLKNTYASATFNQTATIASVDHSGTNLIAWPRAVTLPGV